MAPTVLLLTPPLVDPNTPYPATTYLTGFLRSRNIQAIQRDASLDLLLNVCSKKGVAAVREIVAANPRAVRNSPLLTSFMENFEGYMAAVEPAIRFLQGRDPGIASLISTRRFFPESPRISEVWAYEMLSNRGDRGDGNFRDPLTGSFGRLGLSDKARYLASVFLEDIAAVIQEGIDDLFSLTKYGSALAGEAERFAPLQERLESSATLIERMIDDLAVEYCREAVPTAVGLTVPFPGNVYGAFRMARAIKTNFPRIPVIMGGGYVNTQLRRISDPKIFDYVDFVTLDDGEAPLLALVEFIGNKRPAKRLLRTFVREKGRVVFLSSQDEHDIPHSDTGTPIHDGLKISDYFSASGFLCPLPRISSLGIWNKLTLAHGCYWKKCAFCDTSLDYIGRFQPASAKVLVDRIKSLIEQTGSSCFHFVDEAAPPSILRALSELLVKEKIRITWRGMIRFDRNFTPDLARLMAQSGCVAVEAGLEVANDRILELMGKGITVEQAAQVGKTLADAGIIVHAFLMYGFPGQTLQETVDALEYVRQLFKAGCLQSAVWSRFLLTDYSPAALDPGKFGISVRRTAPEGFSHYLLDYHDAAVDYDIEAAGAALFRAMSAFLQGHGFDVPIREWFKSMKVPSVTVPTDAVERFLRKSRNFSTAKNDSAVLEL